MNANYLKIHASMPPHGMESHHKRKHLVGISGAVNVRPDSESEDRQIHTNDYKCCAN